jgi:hypothetical protein
MIDLRGVGRRRPQLGREDSGADRLVVFVLMSAVHPNRWQQDTIRPAPLLRPSDGYPCFARCIDGIFCLMIGWVCLIRLPGNEAVLFHPMLVRKIGQR